MSKETDIDYALDLVRLLIGIVKNKDIPDSEADKNVGQILAKLDVVMQRIDNTTSKDNN